ncbi:DUF742 domain-containing protein [Natronoglycomyces albus]|uniref:DUF742 domain-containing protein n=1 Tax=Natronoglycomyces albus TaxID=2811108 RepID=A0A895XRL8_9ACTN|nr:DUF742 domain-containing protein [Natronoglycomyces albus]QSB05206.1 DUF742 domain-containing protein [Natronoglycomyces albus]
MRELDDDLLLDEDAGRLVRPYTVSKGRTAPTARLDLLSMVCTTGTVPFSRLDSEHAEVLSLCCDPISVAEMSAHMRLPAAVIKVLLSDLVECGAITSQAPDPLADPTDRSLLEALLNGLQRRL